MKQAEPLDVTDAEYQRRELLDKLHDPFDPAKCPGCWDEPPGEDGGLCLLCLEAEKVAVA